MRTILSLCLAVLCAGPASTQPLSVAGTIIDPSGRPVADAEIHCGKTITRSRADGTFDLAGIDRCEATIRTAGFADQTATLTGSNNRIALSLAGLTQQVVVSATRRETTVEQAGVAATIFTEQDLAQRQFPQVLDLLREVPGVQVAKTGSYGTQTSVFTRGAAAVGTLVLLDGIPLNPPGDALDFAHLLTTGIDRIEIVRGPQSAVFGADASAGVVQLFTRRGNPESRVPHGSMTYERGSFQTDRWIANLTGGAGEKFDYAGAMEQFHTVGEFSNSYYRNTTGTLNLGYRLSPGAQLRGILRATDGAVGLPGLTAYQAYDTDAHEENRSYSAALRLDDVRGRNFVQRVLATYRRERDIYSNPFYNGPYPRAALVRDQPGNVPRVYLERLVDPQFPPSQIPAGLRLVRADAEQYALGQPSANINSRTGANYQGTWAQGNSSLTFGYDYERQSGVVSRTGVDRNDHGVFAHEQYTLGKRIFLAGGVRFEHSSLFGSKFAPRGSASFLLAGAHGPLSSTILRLSAGRGIREPSLLMSYARESYFVGNPNLRLEKTNSYELGLVQEWFARRVQTEVAAFRNDFKDLIAYVSSPATYIGSWDNIAASYGRGVELSARARVWRTMTVTGQHTWLWTRITQSATPASLATGIGQELARRPRHSGALTLSVAPSRWSFQTSAIYFGERQESYDLFGTTRASAYWNVSANASFRATRHVTPYLRIDNLINARYQEVLGYYALSRAIRGGTRLEW